MLPKAGAFLSFLSMLLYVVVADDAGLDADPYLQYRPAYARSLPIQILLTGIVLTLVAVLFIHLIFTAQYHWPLAPVNYVLQISGVTTLLISLIATLHVVLSATLEESQKWPYMLSYIAVNVPPMDTSETSIWTKAELATWLIMNAATSGLIQITHIQFLTLLYPSRLEARLIFYLLSAAQLSYLIDIPLAVLAAVMQLTPISGGLGVIDVATAIRNVCNATLSLLFTVALFVWGILVNRKQAWRTDGGTAAFGCAALSLALVSTALNFLYIPREEEYVWLPGLMWAVVLWQSFLGWWWWVGAGTGANYDFPQRREGRRQKKKRASKEHRKGTRERAQLVWRGVTGAFGVRQEGMEMTSTIVRRRSVPHAPDSRSMSPEAPRSLSEDRHATSSSTASFTSNGTLPRILPAAVYRWYTLLRQAHVAATRQQAIERADRIRELEEAGAPNLADTGWGLGSFAWRSGRVRQHGRTQERDRYPRRNSQQEQNEAASCQETDVTSVGEDSHDEEDRPDKTSETMKREVVRHRQSLWWWGPLGRWRLQDSTVY
ncbi:uncharacterized protein BT62DRAFT_917339 [Guyanagaster necrorhizus]|uniref:Uncharacterized protein n=1 Tax=Guyanagaster necrorhizus TaxID=856835 RepID=A0A9P7VZA4_9AGAR|nr:uncharacterized protein BT62DRAFT_917339 [Guyanagaster necrorhizus MCA 3950]KAG7449709.1 hypothetical protein BT62DRAFT_917339 [Guyanagaster necrorhizus MCA 3950]